VVKNENNIKAKTTCIIYIVFFEKVSKKREGPHMVPQQAYSLGIKKWPKNII
jgi:hypothetical protein